MTSTELREKLVTFSAEEIQSGEAGNKISKIKKNFPVYISIDKDILDEEYSETNWSQGKMSLPVLERLLMPFLKSGNILGIDICGECQQECHCRSIWKQRRLMEKQIKNCLIF